MAIKMTKRGIPPQERIYYGHCSRCHSEFECTGADLLEQNFGRGESSTYIECTACRQPVFMVAKPLSVGFWAETR